MLGMSTTFPPTEPCCSFSACDILGMPYLTKICIVLRQVPAQFERGTEVLLARRVKRQRMLINKRTTYQVPGSDRGAATEN